MPWKFPSNVPKVAKHWSDTEKRICTSAANNELQRSGDDKKAIFACVGAVKNHRKNYKQGPEDEFDKLGEKSSKLLQNLVESLYAGELILDEFDDKFRRELKEIYLKAMILARGDKEITEDDLATLQKKLDEQYDYFDGFMKDLGTGRYSQQKALWRAGMYGFPKNAFTYYSVPADVADLMPTLPGDCLGGGLCGCHLEVSYDDDGTAYVDWVLDPLKEHCVLCVAAASETYVFTPEQLLGE